MASKVRVDGRNRWRQGETPGRYSWRMMVFHRAEPLNTVGIAGGSAERR